MTATYRNLSSSSAVLPSTRPSLSLVSLHAGGSGWSRDPLIHSRRQHPSLRTGATASGSPNDADDDGKDKTKADFSAYWAIKIRVR